MTAPPRSVRVVLLCAITALIVGACGVPRDGRARIAERDDVPFDLLAPTIAQPATTTTVRDTRPVEVFFVREGRLVAVERRVRAPVTLTLLLGSLLAGPTQEEADDGLRSALSASEVAESVDVVRGVARIALSPTFTEAPSEEQSLALAQLVYTATSLPGVGAATFLLGEAPVEVPRPDGSLSATVTRDDFASLLSGVG